MNRIITILVVANILNKYDYKLLKHTLRSIDINEPDYIYVSYYSNIEVDENILINEITNSTISIFKQTAIYNKMEYYMNLMKYLSNDYIVCFCDNGNFYSDIKIDVIRKYLKNNIKTIVHKHSETIYIDFMESTTIVNKITIEDICLIKYMIIELEFDENALINTILSKDNIYYIDTCLSYAKKNISLIDLNII